ncbi:hypothetical protein Pfo_002340 [Paulownia fortunei]|nr:hypothetical protein Pfo_002340 [Paulownia fortunei]
MDFLALIDALASKSYDQIASICDTLIFRSAVASEGIAFRAEWPYAIHLLGHIYMNDVIVRCFLWKTIPLAVKESQLGVLAAWKIGRSYMALFLGMNEDDAANYAVQQGWTVDPAPQMLTVKKQAVATEQKLDPSKLQLLTEYVFHLEH